ncbi:MAG TPA: DUF4340 domain-containing protein, partial [Polyangiaceae bacterium]|nr:DUF4340 domain-containing protein [Polyangiaceae bacterium]
MAESNTKLYIAVGALVALGGALFLQKRAAHQDDHAHSFEGQNESLPKLELSEDLVKKVTKFTIEQPEKKGDSPKPGSTNTLVKEGETWKLAVPVTATANQTNVESLLKNLPKLTVRERIAEGTAAYANYELGDAEAIHFTAFEADKPVVELWLGKSGGRGQTVRVKGKDGVYVLDGYSSFLYTRDTKGWRDLSILKLDTDKANRVTIDNEHGSFVFAKSGGAWMAEFKKAKGSAGKIKDFDTAKVDDLLRAYKTLNASDFGDGKTLADTGLEKPVATLGITLDDGSKTEILFGSTAEGSSRFAKLPGRDQIYAISSWAADWAVAEESKFVKKADSKAEPSAPPMPGGLPP